MQEINFIFSIAVLIISVIVHEISHGYTAHIMGDPTAKNAGRLSLNPLRHLDPIGSVLVPLITYLGGGFIFGWAKPVPYNPYNLRNQKWGPGVVAIAGPLSNFLVAGVFSLIIRNGQALTFLPISFFEIASLVVFINLILGIFNLVPIPPLDGSKIVFSFLPYKWKNVEFFLERWGFIFLIVFILFFFRLLLPVVSLLFKFFTGVTFF